MDRSREPLLAGAPNFRSMGGIPVAGGRVRDGVLFRSDAFAALSADDHHRIQALGLRTVIDLRRASERAAEPTGLRLVPGGRTVTYSLVNRHVKGTVQSLCGIN